MAKQSRQALEEFFVSFHYKFAKHRFDIGMNNDFNVKMTPIGESSVYSRNRLTAVNLTKNIKIELPRLH